MNSLGDESLTSLCSSPECNGLISPLKPMRSALLKCDNSVGFRIDLLYPLINHYFTKQTIHLTSASEAVRLYRLPNQDVSWLNFSFVHSFSLLYRGISSSHLH